MVKDALGGLSLETIIDSSGSRSGSSDDSRNCMGNRMEKISSSTDDLSSGISFPPKPAGEAKMKHLVVADEMDLFAKSQETQFGRLPVPSMDQDVPDLSLQLEADLPVNNIGFQLCSANGQVDDQEILQDEVPSDRDDDTVKSEWKQFASLREELARSKELNRQLKSILRNTTNNYNVLHDHLIKLVKEQIIKKQEQEESEVDSRDKSEDNDDGPPRQDDARAASPAAVAVAVPVSGEEIQPSLEDSHGEEMSRGLKRSSSGSSLMAAPQETPYQTLTPEKADLQAAATAIRMARVSIGARSRAPQANDGCHWRKCGKKKAKGNPRPRSDFKCTMLDNCPVRRQVQRCAEDKSASITTFEGVHNHPLPPAAMGIASTAVPSDETGSVDPRNSLVSAATTPTSSPNNNLANVVESAPVPAVVLDLTRTPNPIDQQRTRPGAAGAGPLQVPFASSSAAPLPCNQSNFSGPLHTQVKPLSASRSMADAVNQATAATIAADPEFAAAVLLLITRAVAGEGDD